MQGHGGVELWVSRTLPLTQGEDGSSYFQRTDATVLIAEPELIFVDVLLGGVPTLCIVAHAPHRGHPTSTIVTWWDRFRQLLQKYQRNRRTIICIDANAGIGERQPYCGKVFQQDVDTAGQELYTMLQTFDLAVPCTFEDIHRGASETWYSAKATCSGNRNDYVILSRELLPSCLLSEVMPSIDAGNQAVDHLAAVVTMDWWTTSHRPTQKKVNWDRNKLLKADEATWNNFFEDLPTIPWATDLTTHMAHLESYLHDRMAKFFPRDPQQRRNSCLDDEALDLLRQKQQLKKVLCISKQQCDRHQLHEAMRCWNKQEPYTVRPNIVLCILRTTWRWNRYKILSHRIKQQILQTRADWLNSQLEPLVKSDKKSALTILRPLRMGKRVKDLGKKPLQQVRLPNDQLAASPEEACERWRNYFADLEGGKPVTNRQLWDEAMDRLHDLPPPPDHITELPTLLEVERHLQHAAIGKGLGCDLLPGELLRMAAPWLAKAVWPIVVKTALWCDEPLQHKGGRLVVAFKNKGDFTRCQNHRGLLVSCSLGENTEIRPQRGHHNAIHCSTTCACYPSSTLRTTVLEKPLKELLLCAILGHSSGILQTSTTTFDPVQLHRRKHH